MVDSLLWVMHDLYHEPYGSLNNYQPHSLGFLNMFMIQAPELCSFFLGHVLGY